MRTYYRLHTLLFLRSLACWAVEGPTDASVYLYRTAADAVRAVDAQLDAVSL